MRCRIVRLVARAKPRFGTRLIAVAATWGAREVGRRLRFGVWIERAAACECLEIVRH